MTDITKVVEDILQVYTKDAFYDDLKKARDLYITKTGKIDEETDEYESRMNSFNDWYLFNYQREDGQTIVQHYLDNNEVSEEIKKALLNVNYSLFHFAKINLRKQIIIKDILHSSKFVLPASRAKLGLVEDDLFVGRSIEFEGEFQFLNGVCTIPREVMSVLKKESKKIRKLNNDEEEEVFLLNLERLKTRSIQYGHIDSSKIFTF